MINSSTIEDDDLIMFLQYIKVAKNAAGLHNFVHHNVLHKTFDKECQHPNIYIQTCLTKNIGRKSE